MMKISNFKKTLFFSHILLLFSLISCTVQNGKEEKSPVDYVNPYIGNISHLLVPTFPTVSLPNSMLRVLPAKREFTTDRLSNLPVISVSHRGSSAFSLYAYHKKEDVPTELKYSYDLEKITPYSYEVYLDEMNIGVKLGVSHQSGIYRLTFNDAENPAIMLATRNGKLTIVGNSISGYQMLPNQNENIDTKVYIYLETEQQAEESGILNDEKIGNEKTGDGRNTEAVIRFPDNTKTINLRYGVSLISEDQAKKNLYREMDGFNLEKTIAEGRDIWNNTLSKIKVEGGSEDNKTVFYTALYRTYERPVCISEDGNYYSPFDGKIHADNGKPFYTDDWIWDTYRATHPLRVLTEKEMELNIIRSFIRSAEQMENLWMPTFPTINGDRRAMNSNHGVATVLDAYVKGLDDFDLEKAYQACKGAITEKTLAPWSAKKAGDLDDFFKEHGYFPALREGQEETSDLVHSFEGRQPVAVTLGTVYDEWCLSEIARILGKQDEANDFLFRSYNYYKIYNHETAFFHPKDDKGEFIEPFDYRFSGGMGARRYYDENNGWTYRWDVQHNIGNLVQLMGGNQKFVENLDATFNEPLGRSKYAFYAQLPDQTGNVGQFSMANEPSFHIPYLYNYAGEPWKTQKRIRKLLKEWFRNDLMGIPGDEDGGGMSAFVAFSQLGFYPVTPGSPSYNIGSPIFSRSEINLGDGNSFTIIAQNVSDDNKYIQSAKLNGKEWNKPWFSHDEIKYGGTLELEMGPVANKDWGSTVNAAPPSARAMD